jgi:hypothetical protein
MLVRPVSQELEGRRCKHALGWVDLGYSGAGGKLIHEKTRSNKSRDTVPLRRL